MKKKKTSSRSAVPADAAYLHFKLKSDPFTTLSLRPQNLEHFIGRELLVDRVSSALFSLSNVGLAGEPGVGKSSLMRVVQSKVPSRFHWVAISVPMHDAAYFFSELLREILVAVPKVKGMDLKALSRRLEKEDLGKNEVFSLIRDLVRRLDKPLLVFVDGLEKIQEDRVKRLNRSERTLQLLEEVKGLLELPNLCFAVALQEEFYAKVRSVVQENGDPTVLGLFRHIVLIDKFTLTDLKKLLSRRLEKAGFKGTSDQFFEPEALILAQALCNGNPRRFLYLLSEGMYRGYRRKAARVEFQDVFEALNEHLKLDTVCRKLLYFLAKSGRAVASNTDLQAYMGLDMISIARRFDILAKNHLVEMVEVVNGSKVYALPGTKNPDTVQAPLSVVKVPRDKFGDKIFNLFEPEDN